MDQLTSHLNFLDTAFYGNSIKIWIFSLVLIVLTYFVLRIFIRFFSGRLSKMAPKTKTKVDDIFLMLIERMTSIMLIVFSVFVGSLLLEIKPSINSLLTSAVILTFLFQAAVWGTTLISYFIEQYVNYKMEHDAAAATTVSALGFLGKIVLYSALLLVALDNLGFNITTLVAGLGVGGIAVALALENILGDLFASLSIVLDKPFVVGDFIIVNEYLGAVEHVGLKTTRIRSLSGEQLIFSNTDLLKSRIRNYKRMEERRVVFGIGVIYQTEQEQLAKIPGYIRKIIEEQKKIRFDRAHFKEYGNFSLNFEIVYWVLSSDYNVYMDIQQAINLAIFKKFAEEGIEFAYPTQTLILNQDADKMPNRT